MPSRNCLLLHYTLQHAPSLCMHIILFFWFVFGMFVRRVQQLNLVPTSSLEIFEPMMMMMAAILWVYPLQFWCLTSLHVVSKKKKKKSGGRLKQNVADVENIILCHVKNVFGHSNYYYYYIWIIIMSPTLLQKCTKSRWHFRVIRNGKIFLFLSVTLPVSLHRCWNLLMTLTWEHQWPLLSANILFYHPLLCSDLFIFLIHSMMTYSANLVFISNCVKGFLFF